MKAIYIIVLLMFISVSKAQSHYDELYSYFVKSRYFDLNLNGPVLRMQYFFTEYNIGTNQTINNWTIINNEKRYLGSPYVEFDIKNQRSEEHTSELQSRENLVCRLLLEK